ncbi:MAG: hypothetical protein CMJ38_04755 [Phycisphaerae bacterium]|nr:hypothetical protein [Phycisphaerae bacterium]
MPIKNSKKYALRKFLEYIRLYLIAEKKQNFELKFDQNHVELPITLKAKLWNACVQPLLERVLVAFLLFSSLPSPLDSRIQG